jgi:hypothetical protein
MSKDMVYLIRTLTRRITLLEVLESTICLGDVSADFESRLEQQVGLDGISYFNTINFDTNMPGGLKDVDALDIYTFSEL